VQIRKLAEGGKRSGRQPAPPPRQHTGQAEAGDQHGPTARPRDPRRAQRAFEASPAEAQLAGGGPAVQARAADDVTACLAGTGPFTAVVGSMMVAALGAAALPLQGVEAFPLERGPMMVEPTWRPRQILHNTMRRHLTNFLFTPVMAPVQALPGFAAATHAMGLDVYWRQSGHQPEFRV
jgi:hypothetical protein